MLYPDRELHNADWAKRTDDTRILKPEFGYCPICGEPARERDLTVQADTCAAGRVYPSELAKSEPST